VKDGRRCAKCGRTLEISEFPANPRMRDSLSSWCRCCHADASASYRERNRERLRREALDRYYRRKAAVRAAQTR
jgi:hypothetical protein